VPTAEILARTAERGFNVRLNKDLPAKMDNREHLIAAEADDNGKGKSRFLAFGSE
jgi:hypothetical protein